MRLETEIANNLIKPLFDSLSDFASLVTFVEAMTVRKAKSGGKIDTQRFYTEKYWKSTKTIMLKCWRV